MFKIYEKWRFFRKCRKISILVKFSKNFDFDHDFRKNFGKITILDKIGENFSKNVDFSQIFKDIWYWSKFIKMDFFWKIRKMSILFKFWKNFDFDQIFEKFRFWSWFSKKNLKKLRFWTKLAKIFQNMSILVKFSKIFDFGPNL